MRSPAPVASARIVDDRGRQTPELSAWVQTITNGQIIEGEGSPENQVSAPRKALYFRTDGSSGSILYIKKQDAISGDQKRGWVAV